MSVVVVTRAGKGDVYVFENSFRADEHPLVQIGDAMIDKFENLRYSLTIEECAIVSEKVGNISLSKDIKNCPKESNLSMKDLMKRLWDSIISKSPKPPTDTNEICRKISEDRISTRYIGIHLRPRGEFNMNEASVVEKAVSEEVETKKHRPIPRDAKYSDSSIKIGRAHV